LERLPALTHSTPKDWLLSHWFISADRWKRLAAGLQFYPTDRAVLQQRDTYCRTHIAGKVPTETPPQRTPYY